MGMSESVHIVKEELERLPKEETNVIILGFSQKEPRLGYHQFR